MMQPADNDQENANPPCQPSKYIRFIRSVTFFVIDVVLWTCFWPRGTTVGLRTLGIIFTRYLAQGVWTLCSYALYSTLLVQSGQEHPSFVSDSTSRLLGLDHRRSCGRMRRDASLMDIFSTRGDQPGAEEDVDEVANSFLAAIDRAKATYTEEDVISEVENSWSNKTDFKDIKLNHTAVPVGNISKPAGPSIDKFSTSRDTAVSEEKQISLEEMSKGFDKGQNVTDEIDDQLWVQEDTLRKDHLMVENWLRQSNGFNSNQSLVDEEGPEVKAVAADEKMNEQVDFSSVDVKNSTLAVDVENSTWALLDLRTLHPSLFPADDEKGNGTHEDEQGGEAEPKDFTEEKERLLQILMGCAFTVAALVVILVCYILLCSEWSVCRVRARYLLEQQNAEAQQELAFQYMEAASDRESLRARARKLEVELQEKTDIGTFSIRTGLDHERDAEYTVDIKKRLSLKRGMAKAELDEVRDNIKRNKTIVDEMAVNMGVSIENKSG